MERFPTIFVDNLPHQIRKIWVYNLFSKFGKIRDIFIPYKKSKITGCSFGFVRFNKVDEAYTAITETNNCWCWNHKLMVKFARFLKRKDNPEAQGNSFSYGSKNQSHQFSQNGDYRSKGFQGHSLHSRAPYLNEQYRNTKSSLHNQAEARGKEVWRKKGTTESSKQGEERNAKVSKAVKIVDPLNYVSQVFSIQAFPSGNGWLYRSAVAKIRRLVSTKNLEHIFKRKGVHNIQIKAIGGRFVIITFSEATSRDTIIKQNWVTNWFEEIKPWNGEQASDERFAWVSCFGMPLHAWSIPTFKEIGSKWGDFLQVDDSTLKETSYVNGNILVATKRVQKIDGSIELVVDGMKSLVRVEEVKSFRFIDESRSSIFPITYLDLKEVEDDDDMEHNMDDVTENIELKHYKDNLETDVSKKTVVEHEKEDVKTSKINKEGIDSRVVAFSGGCPSMEDNNDMAAASSSSGIVASTMGSGKVMDTFNGDLNSNQNISKDGCNHYENIEDSTAASPVNLETNGEEYGDDLGTDAYQNDHEVDTFEDSHIPIQATVKGGKGKKKRKTIDEILGFSKINSYSKRGGRNKNKCVVLRSAVAAAALSASISSDGINNRNRIVLNEAQTIWEINKLNGIGYDGDEEEVISKIAEMVQHEKDMAAAR